MTNETNGLSHFITKKVGKAIWDYRMIKDGDRILVAVSGGKDSLSMLRILKERTKFVPINYELIACHVDMGFEWVKKDLLVDYFEQEGVRHVAAEPNRGWRKEGEPFGCFWCSWNRRKALFAMAKKLGCSKIALGHHMDDITETLLLNLMFNGEICTMRPYQEMFRGRLALIRPLAYVEEKRAGEARREARTSGYQVPVPARQDLEAETCQADDTRGRASQPEHQEEHLQKPAARAAGISSRIRKRACCTTRRKNYPRTSSRISVNRMVNSIKILIINRLEQGK